MTGPGASAQATGRGPCEGATQDAQSGGARETAAGDNRERHAPWTLADEAQRDQALARLAAVRRSDALVASGLSRTTADALAAGEAGASIASLRRWRATVRDLPSGGRLAALIDRPRPGRPSSIDGEMREELVALLNEYGEHLTARHAQRTLSARCGRSPSRSTLNRVLARYRREHARELSAVTNPDRHRSHRKPAGGDAAAHVTRLNQEWELDSTTADIMCADGKRYAIVAAIDVWSRRARVLVVPTSRATAIAALLRRCILDWGVPETVRTDEGRDYTSRHVLNVLADLNICHDPCPPYSPERKPFVERFLGTLARDLFAFLPGFTGHDVAQAKALRDRKSFAARRDEDDIETFRCTLTAEELQAECDKWCLALYEHEPHSGLGGATPYARAASWAEPVRRVRDERALDALLAAPAGDGWRTVGKGGIRLDCADYIAGPLGGIVGERVRVRRDPADLDRIFVYRADGAFVCVAEDPARTGTDRAAVAAAMRRSYNDRNRETRARARALAKRHRPERAMAEVLAKAAEDADRIVALPRKGETHETPALKEAARAAEAAAKADEADAATERPAQSKLWAGIRWLTQEEEAEAADAETAPVPPGVREARKRVAAANRLYREEDEDG